ncbi:MAG TPA: hypothetical protein VJN89_12050 [Candidatus Acidoferrum sp.]|nr:hypothetical protein [Candidatus Acidoferrum sp.]
MKTINLMGLLLLVSGSLVAQDRAHELASRAGQQSAASCPKPNNLTLQQCHDQFPDGCSAATHPNYDAYLDFLKDQDPDPGLASTKNLAAADFKSLEAKLPQLSSKSGKGKAKKSQPLNASNHATFANQLAGLGEGNIYTVIAYLYFAQDTSKASPGHTSTGETCNCRLADPADFDYHIGLGFDAKLAAQARSQHPKEGSALFSQLQKGSVVAEMTPYPRHTRHANWTFARVSSHQGEQVKVVGQLMVDNYHFKAVDDCALPGAATGCWRSTIWEMHPLTKFYVCNVSSGCDASSPDSAWTDLDNP